MMERGSTHAKIMIEILLNIHALTNMHRAGGQEEYRQSAEAWLDGLQDQLTSLRVALTEEIKK